MSDAASLDATSIELPSSDAPHVDFSMAQPDPGQDETRVRLHLSSPGADAGEDGAELEPESDRIDRETFAQMFVDAWAVPGMVSQDFAPLAVPENKHQSGITTGRVIYDFIAPRYPWMLPSKSAFSGEVIVAVMFLRGQAVTLSAIRAERRARAEEESDQEAQG